MIKNVYVYNNKKIMSDVADKFVNFSMYLMKKYPKNYKNIRYIDIPIYEGQYAINCDAMFYGGNSLVGIDGITYFDTSYVTDMGEMFQQCNKLSSLDLSNFDTSKVTNMWGLFSNCISLRVLDLSSFDTSKVTDMGYMFNECKSLTTIKGTLDFSSCTFIQGMFDNTPKLRNVHLKNVPRSLLNTDGSLKGAGGTLNETYIIDNILEGK